MGNDGTNFSGCGRDAVGGGTVTSREALSGNDERGSVGTEVVEELDENIDGEETMVRDVVVSKTKNAEENSLSYYQQCHECLKGLGTYEDGKTTKLDGLASNGINRGNSDPISWNCSGTLSTEYVVE